MMEILIYLLGALASWYFMFQFMCWFGPRTWKHVYHHTMLEYQRKKDLEFTALMSLWWPISAPSLLFISFIWSIKK